MMAVQPELPTVYERALDILQARQMNNMKEQLQSEYDKVRSQCTKEHSSEGEKKRNAHRNRYINVIPLDYNRIKLQGQTSDYINASTLKSDEAALPPWRYIAAQGPLNQTVKDFWAMVVQQECTNIVMLTKCIENRTEKCAPYFPIDEGEKQAFGPIQVTVLYIDDPSKGYTHRLLEVTNEEEQKSLRVNHYHYHQWSDHGVPDDTEPLRELSEKLAIYRQQENQGHQKVLVHCSAGIGRTGTFCTVDIILQRLRYWQDKKLSDEKLRELINVQDVVTTLRRQRSGMVQTVDQYSFCYRAIIDEVKSHCKK